MKNKDDLPEQAAPSASSGQDLRRRAEEIAREKAAQSAEDLESLSSPVGDFQGAPEETRQALHELRVHQIEKWLGMNMDITDRRPPDRAGPGAEETPPGNDGAVQ